MKKALFLLIFIVLTVSSYAEDDPVRNLFIEGTAERTDQRQFFLRIFTIEARTAGFTLTENKEDADYTFKFAVVPNTQIGEMDDNQYILKVSLVNNKTNLENVSFDFYFTELNEMYEHTQSIFHRATVFLPSSIVEEKFDRSWQNKLLYLRMSINYPIAFYALHPEGLIAGMALYEGTYEEPGELIPLGNIINPQPGVTLGLEFQFFRFMSLEGYLQASLGDTTTYSFYNFAAGGELKLIFKGNYFMFQPYGAYLYNFNVSPIFAEFPVHSAGGGVQIAVRGGRNGAFFVDLNYMHSFGYTAIHNPFIDPPLAPYPDVIYYNRFVVGLGLGYKVGMFDRR